MSQLLSNRHLECRTNGHLMQGLASDERPYEFLDGGEMANWQTGQDGGLYGTTIAMLGQDLSIKLQPASPSAKWWMQQKQLWRNAIRMRQRLRTYRTVLSDVVQGRVCTLTGGQLLNVPNFSEPGQTYIAVVRYELIDVNLDNAVFSELFESAANAMASPA